MLNIGYRIHYCWTVVVIEVVYSRSKIAKTIFFGGFGFYHELCNGTARGDTAAQRAIKWGNLHRIAKKQTGLTAFLILPEFPPSWTHPTIGSPSASSPILYVSYGSRWYCIGRVPFGSEGIGWLPRGSENRQRYSSVEDRIGMPDTRAKFGDRHIPGYMLQSSRRCLTACRRFISDEWGQLGQPLRSSRRGGFGGTQSACLH